MEKYKKKLTEYEDTLKNKYSGFDYDAEADELFRLQRAQLERNQDSGVSDVLARYAANTGMAGSSEAMAAAQQTASKYNSMIADALTAAEEKAYSRWAAERADLEAKMAQTRAEALGEADTRLALGDLSGYRGLGYDTSAYEAQLAAAAADKAAAAAQADYQNKLADAQARAQYGDLSGLKALGYDTSAYEAQLKAQAEASKEEVGMDGRTESQYTSTKEFWLDIYKSTDDEEVRAEALEQLKKNEYDYNGMFTTYELNMMNQLTHNEAEELLNKAKANDMTLSVDEYMALAAYYYRNPYTTKDGRVYSREAALSALGIKMRVQPKNAVQKHTTYSAVNAAKAVVRGK